MYSTEYLGTVFYAQAILDMLMVSDFGQTGQADKDIP